MSASDAKRKWERVHFNMFRQLLADFPVGDVDQGESPDFKVKTPNGVLGIEVTSICDTSERTVEGWRAKAVSTGQSLYEQRGGPAVTASFHWAQGLLPAGETHMSLGQKFVALVEAHVPQAEQGRVSLEWRELREAGFKGILDFVQIGRFAGETTTTWLSGLGATWGHSRHALAQERVAKKEKKLHRYRSTCDFDEVWLLLGACRRTWWVVLPT